MLGSVWSFVVTGIVHKWKGRVGIWRDAFHWCGGGARMGQCQTRWLLLLDCNVSRISAGQIGTAAGRQ